MHADFDTLVPRRETGCIKYDRKPHLDPYWVADMDFPSPACIQEALHKRVDHGVFGYAQPHKGLETAILGYLLRRHQLAVPDAHLVHLGGVVPALSLAARAFCSPGDSLMTCTPVYPPFLGVHQDAKAHLITVDHIRDGSCWTFDWDALESAVRPDTRAFLLCNPQNPLGQVIPRADLERLARFCQRHDLVLVSDEIHCDLVLDETATPFTSALRLPSDTHNRIVCLMSPSKTWNIAGLGYAFAIIPDDGLRRRFLSARGHTLAEINALGYYAAEAAYRDGEPWRLELLTYLRGNRDTLAAHLAEAAPQLVVHPGEATYLAWIDARPLGVANPAAFFEEKAALFLSDGAFFGWPGFLRMNFGCPRSHLLQGLGKMIRALRGLAPGSAS